MVTLQSPCETIIISASVVLAQADDLERSFRFCTFLRHQVIQPGENGAADAGVDQTPDHADQ
ncbi:MAG: hypothetical protein ACYSUS_08980 [Planctomycetota bacterium]